MIDTDGVVTRSYEELCDEGREAASQGDRNRFKIGDLACEVETRYGEHTIIDFAKAIGTAVKSVTTYRTVCRLYIFSRREIFLTDNPMLTYTHLRDAMVLGDVEEAYKFLETASADGLSVEAARIALTILRGKPVPPHKLLDVPVSIFQAKDGRILLHTMVTTTAYLETLPKGSYTARLIITGCPNERPPTQ